MEGSKEHDLRNKNKIYTSPPLSHENGKLLEYPNTFSLPIYINRQAKIVRLQSYYIKKLDWFLTPNAADLE